MRIKLQDKPEGIIHLYDLVASMMDYSYEEIQNLSYDCTKINVAQDIFDDIDQSYKDEGKIDNLAMDWVCFGPKVDDSLPTHTVEIQEGFIIY